MDAALGFRLRAVLADREGHSVPALGRLPEDAVLEALRQAARRAGERLADGAPEMPLEGSARAAWRRSRGGPGSALEAQAARFANIA